MKIRWTKRALYNLDVILDCLEKEWGKQVVQVFSSCVLRVLSALEGNPKIGRIFFKDKQIRGLIITKHNTLFYRIKNNEIIILQVFDNRMHPTKKVK